MAVTVTRLISSDVAAVARLHQAAFPAFFLSRLGTPFLVQFYRGFVDDDTAVTVVARDGAGMISGVVVGTTEPADFFGRLLRSRWLGFASASARAVLRDPRSTSRLLRAVRYRGSGSPGTDGALLSSICVDSRVRGSGVGRVLVDAWLQELAERGGGVAFLTTDADGNDAVNRFYASSGWHLSDSFTTREGRRMNRYTISVNGASC